MNPAELHALLTAALPDEGLTADDVETCCFGPECEVLGDEQGAAVVKFHDWGGGYSAAWILLVAVAPGARRRGVGRQLADEAVAWAAARGAREVHLGAAIPRYVWPGVDFAFTPALCLFEAAGFEPRGVAFDMAIDTAFRAEPPAGVRIEQEAGAGAVDLARRAYPHWEDEVARGVERGTCFSARDTDGATIAFAAHSVNRHGLVGPMATDPSRRSRGTGHALLGAVCADVADRFGVATTNISWVGPARFYAKAGATVSRVYLNATRRL
jgi:GNAT superfamily N-acetyltransferase